MWVLGHLALGYFSAFLVGKYSREKIFIPLIFFISLLPDLDEFFRGYLLHRGPTHSIVVAIVIFIPIYLIFKSGWAYFAALASHQFADLFIPSSQLFWPLSLTWFGVPSGFRLIGLVERVIEIVLFAIMIVFIVRRRRILFDSPSEPIRNVGKVAN